MSARRLVVVLRWPRGSTLHNAVLFSLAAHVAFGVAALTLPSLRSRPDAPLPTLDVVLVSPLVEPAPPAPVTQPPAPPAPKPPPPEPEPEPEGPSATPEDPPAAPVEKPEPEPVDPKPVKKPDPKPPAPKPLPPPATDPDPLANQAPDEPRGPISAGAAAGALAGMGSEFDWYRDSVIRALYTSWRQPFATGLRDPLEVTIAFEINRDGSVSGVRIAESSGHTQLDRSAFRAVLEAQLPPLPRNHGRNSQPALFVFHLDPQSR